MPPSNRSSEPGTGRSQSRAYRVSSTSRASITTKAVPVLEAFFMGTATTFCSSVGLQLNTKMHPAFSKSQMELVVERHVSACEISGA